MAELEIDGEDIVLRLTAFEVFEGIHESLRAPRSAVLGITVIDNAHASAGHGLRIGTGIPGVTEVGRFISVHDRTFAVVHYDTPRAVRVELDGQDFDDWIVGAADPEAVVTSLRW